MEYAVPYRFQSKYTGKEILLVDTTLTPFATLLQQKKYSALPRFSFYGLHQVFFSGTFLIPTLNHPSRKKNPSERQRDLLCFLFNETSLHLEDKLQSKNTPTWIWNAYWGMPRTKGSVDTAYPTVLRDDLRKKFSEAPEQTLDQIKARISAIDGLNLSEYPDQALLSTITSELLIHLHPDCSDTIIRSNSASRLALLCVMALLGPDGISECADKVWDWMKPPAFAQRPADALFTEDHIDMHLLPDLSFRGKTYSYDTGTGSPLHQILLAFPGVRFLLLTGQPGVTTLSGAGKTCSLLFLSSKSYLSDLPEKKLFLPLAQIYTPHTLHGKAPLSQYIQTQFHFTLEHLNHPLLLLDGLDELNEAELVRFMEELEDLRQKKDFRCVISCKTPLSFLPTYETILHPHALWSEFETCTLLPMTPAQQKNALRSPEGFNDAPEIPADLKSRLNTPFLLSVFQKAQYRPQAPAARALLDRLGLGLTEQRVPRSIGELIYFSLAVTAVRWFETSRSNRDQAELDLFFLFHTLPAAAFKSLSDELYDPRFHPSSRDDMDEELVSTLITLTYRCTFGTNSGAQQFPAYRKPEQFLNAAKLFRKQMDLDHFTASRVQSLFYPVEKIGRTPLEICTEFHFQSNALRDSLAALHIANLFLLARENGIPDSEQVLPFAAATLEFLPAPILTRAAEFLHFLLSCQGLSLHQLLRSGPESANQAQTLSRLLYCHIGGRMCEYAGLPEPLEIAVLWYGSTFIHPSRPVARCFLHSHIFSLTAIDRCRRRYSPTTLLDLDCREICACQKQFPHVHIGEGQHSQANFWLHNIELLLNAQADPESDLPAIDLSADGDLFPWLSENAGVGQDAILPVQTLVEALHQVSTGQSSGVFPEIDEETAKLAPAFLLILEKGLMRYQVYQKREFLNSPALEYLCTQSLRAKAASIYAACHGVSGAAINLLGAMLENDTEALENDPRLPFFSRNPHLHLAVDGLSYGADRYLLAYQLYDRMCAVSRGIQSYTQRKRAELLLRRNVILSPSGQPQPGPTAWRAFSDAELSVIDCATLQALNNAHPAAAQYWRIRYLRERLNTMDKASDAHKKLREETVSLLLRTCEAFSVTETLREQGRLNFYSAMLITESLALGCSNFNRGSDLKKLNEFYRMQSELLTSTVKFTTGTRPQLWQMYDGYVLAQSFITQSAFFPEVMFPDELF